ncbi:vitamin B12-dependent ribonucleotide reductase [Plakobranchus ocellatus]|uniref:Vitamin B12-dependent ribonucleotide reductase n=1 Tax=Plakobranchus ocellatus TaxID=259542 RepID=A0AAV4CJX4_9GAST|nr:vitamin B12-dependent ribonucleotide reductase [Plakobranchus ocellatus]
MADGEERPQLTDRPKKRKINDRASDLLKQERLSSHTTGGSCNCTRFQCFEVTTAPERENLIAKFNSLSSKDDQDSFLASLISITSVRRRRPREDSQNNIPNNNSYTYVAPIVRGDNCVKIQVCFKAFQSLFGITHRRIATVKTALSETGSPPKDGRGKHNNRLHALSQAEKDLVRQHISSFKGRTSHYSREKSRKLYLPETLSVTKMYSFFTEAHANAADRITYESYRKIFNGDFNISFGYPRSDSCSKCDELITKIDFLQVQLEGQPENQELQKQKGQALTERELHQRKAENFYQRKRAAKVKDRQNVNCLSVAFDFQNELYCPNKTTNDVYYRRQLSLHSFNIHQLGSDTVHNFVYDETVGKKGADEVTSMLFYFVNNVVPQCVRHIEFFCDSCAGQNKNFTVIRFLYYLVHFKKRFDTLKIAFPERGHSYMECDRDLALVNKKVDAEVPSDWMEEFDRARTKPSPYNVIHSCQEDFFAMANFLKPAFKALCPIQTRPIRELVISAQYPGIVKYRNNWHGQMETAAIVSLSAKGKKAAKAILTEQPSRLYAGRLPISVAKFRDLQVLKKFCSPPSQTFFNDLPTSEDVVGAVHEEFDSDS